MSRMQKRRHKFVTTILKYIESCHVKDTTGRQIYSTLLQWARLKPCRPSGLGSLGFSELIREGFEGL